jgi:hypothetical protein
MAKIESSIFREIRKSLDKQKVTFQTRKVGVVIEEKPIPPNIRTEKRQIVRTIYKKLCDAWHYIKPEEKESFRETAQKFGITLFNAFLKTYLPRYLTLKIFKTSEIQADSDLDMGGYGIKNVKIATEDGDAVNLALLKYYAWLTEIFAYRLPGYYYTNALVGVTATLALTANMMYALPFIVPRKSRFDRMNINVTTAASGTKVRLGIYTNEGVYPKSLITDAGELDTGSTGSKDAVIDVTLEPGLYWIILLSSGAPTLGGISAADTFGILGQSNVYATANNSWRITYTYGVLPSTFPTGASPAQTPYLVALRLASLL